MKDNNRQGFYEALGSIILGTTSIILFFCSVNMIIPFIVPSR